MNTSNIPWATLLLGILTVIAALVGGAVVIWGSPGTLSFDQYLKSLEGFAVAVGLLGIGRGIAKHGANVAGIDDERLTDESLMADLEKEPEPHRTHV